MDILSDSCIWFLFSPCFLILFIAVYDSDMDMYIQIVALIYPCTHVLMYLSTYLFATCLFVHSDSSLPLLLQGLMSFPVFSGVVVVPKASGFVVTCKRGPIFVDNMTQPHTNLLDSIF